MKISGMSLMPAANPMPAPLAQLRSGWHKSATTISISTSSIWPRCNVSWAGSLHKPTAASTSAPQARRGPRQPSAPKVSQVVTGRAATLMIVAQTDSTRQLSMEVPPNSIAANGV